MLRSTIPVRVAKTLRADAGMSEQGLSLNREFNSPDRSQHFRTPSPTIPRNADKVPDDGLRADEIRNLPASRQYGLISRTSKAFCSFSISLSTPPSSRGGGVTSIRDCRYRPRPTVNSQAGPTNQAFGYGFQLATGYPHGWFQLSSIILWQTGRRSKNHRSPSR